MEIYRIVVALKALDAEVAAQYSWAKNYKNRVEQVAELEGALSAFKQVVYRLGGRTDG